MWHAKQESTRKRRSKAVPVLGAAGLLSLASGASAQGVGPVGAMPTHTDVSHEITLSEEEVSDVSLATFYVIDKENAAAAQSGVKVAYRGCGRCGGCGGRGCGGCGWRGCRCGGWGCGGCACGWCLPWGCRIC